MGRLVDKVIDNFIEQGIVLYEDREIYAYGLYQGIVMAINILTYILISLYFEMVWESLIFLISYIPLRSYSGGYHARTQIKCYFLSILMIILVLLTIKTVPFTIPMTIGITILSGSIIFILAPVEDSNKPLSYSQAKVFRKVARKILGVELIVIITLLLMRYIMFALPIVLAIGAIGVMVIIGKN